MSKPLSKHEQWLFSLTRSQATEPRAQRAAISREGLTGLTMKDVAERRRQNWPQKMDWARKYAPTVPEWVVAGEYNATAEWHSQPPAGKPVGRRVSCQSLQSLSYAMYDWGRARKRSRGFAHWGAHMVETDNGKGGWDRVVHRQLDYGCVLHPSGRKLAIQLLPGCPWRVVTVRNGRFFFDAGDGAGRRLMKLDDIGARVSRINLRGAARVLRNNGFAAYVTRQSEEQIAAGSAERGRRGKLVLVVDFGQDGTFHVQSHSIPEYLDSAMYCRVLLDKVRSAEKNRRDARLNRERQEREDRIIAARAVFVGMDDSINSGNCHPGTEAFAAVLRERFSGADIGGVRADIILSIRDDVYVRLACRYAARRVSETQR